MSPRILHIYGPLWINSYGFMVALGFLTFVFLCYHDRRAKQFLPAICVPDIMFVGMLAGLIGGRVLFVLQHPYMFSDAWWEMFLPWIGGLSLFGAIIAVLITLTIYVRRRGVSALAFFDLIAIYAPLFQAIARFGCFFAGCCYGAPLARSCWLSVVYTHPDSLAPLYCSLHPAQLYAALGSISIFLLMWGLLQRVCTKRGQLLMLYLLLESLSRFTVDFWRGNREISDTILGLSTRCGTITPYQQITLLLGGCAVVGFCYRTGKSS